MEEQEKYGITPKIGFSIEAWFIIVIEGVRYNSQWINRQFSSWKIPFGFVSSKLFVIPWNHHFAWKLVSCGKCHLSLRTFSYPPKLLFRWHPTFRNPQMWHWFLCLLEYIHTSSSCNCPKATGRSQFQRTRRNVRLRASRNILINAFWFHFDKESRWHLPISISIVIYLFHRGRSIGLCQTSVTRILVSPFLMIHLHIYILSVCLLFHVVCISIESCHFQILWIGEWQNSCHDIASHKRDSKIRNE